MSLNIFQGLANIQSINQEPGASPGAGLKPLMAIAYFVGAPILFFLVIAGVTMLVTAKKKPSSVENIS